MGAPLQDTAAYAVKLGKLTFVDRAGSLMSLWFSAGLPLGPM